MLPCLNDSILPAMRAHKLRSLEVAAHLAINPHYHADNAVRANVRRMMDHVITTDRLVVLAAMAYDVTTGSAR